MRGCARSVAAVAARGRRACAAEVSGSSPGGAASTGAGSPPGGSSARGGGGDRREERVDGEYVEYAGSTGGGGDTEVDVAVVGGGLVGAALVLALSRQPLSRQLRIAIVDRAPPPPPLPPPRVKSEDGEWPAPSARVSAVTPSSGRFLERLGVWGVGAHAPPAAPYEHMQVWDACGGGAVRFHAADAALPALGAVVENGTLLAGMHAALREKGLVENLPPAGVEEIELPAGSDAGGAVASARAALSLSDGTCVRARLVVGADGPTSRVRSLAGINTSDWDYSQKGVVATVRMEGYESAARTEDTAWQRFLPTGPLALLPVSPPGYCNIVWSTTSEHAERLLALSDAAFADAVNDALHGEAAVPRGVLPRLLPSGDGALPPPRAIEAVGRRGAFPLTMRNAQRYVGRRLALAGDAAHVVHPLAGQGVNLGFADAAALAACIERGLRAGLDVGDLVLLREYETERGRAAMAAIAALHGLHTAFGVQSGAAGAVRAAGMGVINALPPVRRAVVETAAGHGPLSWANADAISAIM